MRWRQIAWSTLFMWLLEGHSEAQFHVFTSLAFLAFYRDWKVLLTATLATLVYPIARLALLPESYVVSDFAWWRVFDQTIWVVAENLMLLLAIEQSMKSITNFAAGSAELHLTNERIAQAVGERTRELERSREQYRLIAETTRAIPFELDLQFEPLARLRRAPA